MVIFNDSDNEDIIPNPKEKEKNLALKKIRTRDNFGQN